MLKAEANVIDVQNADLGRSVPPRYRYDVAELYLKQADYDLEAAIAAYKEDEEWEKAHPMQKGKSPANSRQRQSRLGGGLTGQLS